MRHRNTKATTAPPTRSSDHQKAKATEIPNDRAAADNGQGGEADPRLDPLQGRSKCVRASSCCCCCCGRVYRSVVGWWAFDLHPVTSWMRFWFYGLTFVNLHFEHPLYWHALGFPERRNFEYLDGWATSHQFEDGFSTWCYLPKNLLNMGDGGLRSTLHDVASAVTGHGSACVELWRCFSIAISVALLFSAIGFVGRIPPLVVGIGLVCQDGCFQMMRDSNHRLLLPAACCLWLAINDYGQHGAWSLDQAVRRVVGPRFWPFGISAFRDELRCGTSGMQLPKPVAVSRRLCLVTAVCVFFSAGFSKMTQGQESWSIAWANGETLGFKMRARPTGAGDVGTLPKLLTPLLHEKGLIPPLAASSLAMEVLAPLALLPWPWPRRLLALSWAAFHVGVLVTMYNVNYMPSAIVYLTLVLDWGAEDVRYQAASNEDDATIVCRWGAAEDGLSKGVLKCILTFLLCFAGLVEAAHVLMLVCDFVPAEQWLTRVLYSPLFGKSLGRQTLTLEVVFVLATAMLIFMTTAVGLWRGGSCFNLNRPVGQNSANRHTRHQAKQLCSRWIHATVLATLGVAFVLLSAHTTVNHEENWPLSSVPMFSQVRNSSWKFSCIQPGSEMEQLTRERHNFIMSSKSWFRLQAVYWRNSTFDSGASRLFFETMDLTTKLHARKVQNSIPALRDELLAESSRLALFGGTQPLFRNMSATVLRTPFRRKRAPNGLAERLHVAGMDALKRVYLIGERTIDPKQQFAGSDGRMNTFSTFLNHVGEWFGPPLLLWAVPSGPCSEATNAESWTKICNSMSENDRTLARLNGRHRQFLGFQVVSPVCSTSGPGEDSELSVLAAKIVDEDGHFSASPPCHLVTLSQTPQPDFIDNRHVQRYTKWLGSNEPLHAWCQLLLSPERMNSELQSKNRPREQSKRAGSSGQALQCPFVDGDKIGRQHIAVMWPARGSCSEYCSSLYGSCVSACDTRGSCNCDERPMRPEHCMRRWGTKVCVCNHVGVAE